MATLDDVAQVVATITPTVDAIVLEVAALKARPTLDQAKLDEIASALAALQTKLQAI